MANLDKLSRWIGKRFWALVMFGGLAVVIVVLLVVWAGPSGSAEGGNGSATYAVRRDDFTVSVTESGTIKALHSVDISSEVEGQTTIISLIEEGTEITAEDVKNGKVLVELDSSDLEQRFAQQEITFTQAQANDAEAKAGYDIQRNENESEIKKGQIALKFAELDLQKYLGADLSATLIGGKVKLADPIAAVSKLSRSKELGGAGLQRRRELRAKIDLADEELKRADSKLDWTTRLFEKQYVSRDDLDADKLMVKRRGIEHKQAETSLELFNDYEFPKEAAKLLSDYQEAGRELERIRDRCNSKLAQAQAKRRSAAQTFELQQDRLDKLRKQVKACVIKAPAVGMVVYGSSGNFWARMRRPIEVGATVRRRQKIISIPNTAAMSVDVQVHEVRVNKVKPGQKARITVDAFPDKTFTGEVISVAPLADPQHWLSPDLKAYTTKVTIDGVHTFLKPGMSAKVEIIVEELVDVVSIPVQAVANRSGSKVCFVATSDGPKRREVQTGAFNENFIEIVSGLNVGEKVLLNPPRLLGPNRNRSKKKDKDKDKDKKTEKVEAKPVKTSDVKDAKRQKRPGRERGAAGK